MTLVQVYALRCDNCNVASRPGGTSWSPTSTEARALATRNGWERLHNPINVRQGYVNPNNPNDQRRRLDYCPRCAPKIRRWLIDVQQERTSAS